MTKTCDVTAATASGDTVETSLGTITLPSNAKMILKVGVSAGGAGFTTLENSSGFFRVSINNLDVAPAKFPFSFGGGITSGMLQTPIAWYDVNWGGCGNSQVTFYVTMDMAETVNTTFRGCVLYEK